jgi:DUF1680 family protein
MQDHMPLVEQPGATGHAVRAGYVYAAMADLARLTDAPAFERALDRFWRDVADRKLYLTGGVGTAERRDEGYGRPYHLPNASAYCESCASIALVLWQHRMVLLREEAGHADVMELALYNSVLSGLSISGNRFFYQNPLSSAGKHARRPWIGLACCPTNYARIIPQVGGFAYARGAGRLHVNLYAAGEAALEAGGTPVRIVQETDYPWAGRVKLTVSPVRPAAFTLCLRIPSWASGRPLPGALYRFADPKSPPVGLTVNGAGTDAAPRDDGYVHLRRSWRAGDVVVLDLPMPVRRVYADERVEADRGLVALMRGPVVYCLEGVGVETDVRKLALSKKAAVAAAFRPDLLGGVTVLTGKGIAEGGKEVEFTAIPYYAWQNRGPGAMAVWIRECE